MVINPTALAQATRSSRSLTDAKTRVLSSYRTWIRSVRQASRSPSHLPVESRFKAMDRENWADIEQQAPEIQTMYQLSKPVAELRTKIRQEFERHRYVGQLPTIDVLLFKSHAEFQETLNYWKQTSQLMKYFRAEEDPGQTRIPKSFMEGFLEGRN